jgi:hypothetical protein
MRKLLKRLYNNTSAGKILTHPVIIAYNYFRFHIIPEKKFIKHIFKKSFGYKLDINNPITLNEKIQWLKLNDRTPLHTICADKYAVREYIKKIIGEEYLVPLIFQTINPYDIIPVNLPDFPFIIKTNHDSSGGIIVRDKASVNWKAVQNKLTKLLKRNYYYESKEWPYKNIQPCIVVEKLLLDEKGKIPYDYKLHCFHQKVKMIQVDIDRGTSSHCRNWYNTKWEREPYRWSSIKNGRATDPRDTEVEKPESLEKMIILSEKLSKNFVYIRIDWYNISGKLFFGEMTFYHDGGFSPILPEEWDKNLGENLTLPL